MGNMMMFRVVITLVAFSRVPINVVLALLLAITNPVEMHIKRLGAFLLESIMGQSKSVLVRLDRSGRLGMTQFFKTTADGDTILTIKVKGASLGFGSTPNDDLDDGAEHVEGAIIMRRFRITRFLPLYLAIRLVLNEREGIGLGNKDLRVSIPLTFRLTFWMQSSSSMDSTSQNSTHFRTSLFFVLKYIQSIFYQLVMSSPKQETAAHVFRSLDKDGNGKIDRDEYAAALIKMHIPKAITDVVTESVFAKFDTNKDEGIDEKEFIRYFSDEQNAAVHKRIYRSNFEDQYTLVWGLYFCLVGLKLILDSKGLLSDCFPGILDKDDTVVGPALHMTAILGWSWFTGGANVLMQRLLGVSQVFAYGSIAVFWSLLTIYENLVGSIIGAEGFQEPPVLVTILSIGLGLYGIWSILTERAKVKED